MFRDQRTAYRNVLYFEARLLIEIWSPSGRLGHLAVSTSQSWGHRCTPHLPFFLKVWFLGVKFSPSCLKDPSPWFFFFLPIHTSIREFSVCLAGKYKPRWPLFILFLNLSAGSLNYKCLSILRQSKTHLLFLRRELCFTSLRGCCIG